MKKIIVSSSDSNYFELLCELFFSIKKIDLLSEYDFGVLDTGLLVNQIEFLRDNNVSVKNTNWDIEVPSYKVRSRNHLKTQFARAFLPNYFPEYKIYVWLDADTWVNDLNTFLLYEKGAQKNKLCITPQVDRAYGSFAKIDWFMGFPKKIRTINYKNISKSISRYLARELAMNPTLNAGAFAINDNSDLWSIFQKNIILASKKGRIFGTDQVALAISVYKDKLPTEFLPAYCNWMCESHLPIFDDKNQKFVEPYLPHHPIGLMHLAGLDDIRKDKNILVETKDINRNIINKALRFKY